MIYDSLLTKSGQLSLRMNIVRVLSIEVFKCVNGTYPVYLNDMFTISNSEYDFRDKSPINPPKSDNKTFAEKSFRYIGAKLWNSIASHIKYTDDLNSFKSNI